MPFRQHLPHDEISALYHAAIAVGLTTSRAALLDGISPAYVASLGTSASPAAQIHTDLHTLNGLEALTDGSVPLRRWLWNARDLTQARPEFALFHNALAKLSPEAAAAPPSPQAAAAAPAPTPPAAAPPAPARPAIRVPPAAAFPASAAFLSITDLKTMDGPEVHAALSILHRVLRDAIEPLALADLRVLSSLTGAIVLLPDALNRNLHDLLPDWIRALTAAGLAVRAGVSRGLVEMIADADGTVNAIGRCLNIAARLAVSGKNPGVVYEEPYAAHVQTMLLRTHFLHPKHAGGRVPLSIEGKRDEVFTCFADPGTPPRAASEIAVDRPPPFANAVMLAYDLPDFSEGHLRTLVSRFRGVVQEVQRLRQEHGLPAGTGVSFSPGGDGGVLALTEVPLGRALGLATDLFSLLDAADTTQSKDAPVRARIAVHYGQVLLYENAERVPRPTGLALFDADGLAGDKEARHYDAVIVSGALIESAAKGTPEAGRFEQIGPFTGAQGTPLRRYVPKGSPRR